MGHTFMLISIVPELDIPLDTIRLSVEVAAALPPKFMRWWMLSTSLLRPAENSAYRLSLTDEICLKQSMLSTCQFLMVKL